MPKQDCSDQSKYSHPWKIGLGVDNILRTWIARDADLTLLHATAIQRENQKLLGASKAPHIVDIRLLRSISKEASDYLASPKNVRHFSAIAVLTGSLASRIFANIYLFLSRPLIPTRLFTDEKEALSWLKTYLAPDEAGKQNADAVADGGQLPDCKERNKQEFLWKYSGSGILFGALFPIAAHWYTDISFVAAVAESQSQMLGLLRIIDSAPIFLGLFAAYAGWHRDRFENLNLHLERRIQKDNLQFEQTQKHAKIGAWSMLVEGGALSATNQVFEICDLPASTHLQSLDPRRFITEPDFLDLKSAQEMLLKSGESYDMQVKLRTHINREIWVRVIASPTYLGGKIVATQGTFQDITQLKQTEELLHQNKRLAAIGELAAGVGHEINNPLAIASGYLELVSEALVHETRTNSSLRVFLQKISHSLNRIRDIVDELRDYARTGGENFETIELSGVVKNSYGLIRELQEKDGTAIIFSCEGPEIHVRGTSGKIQQIVYNLVQNASDAVESSGTRQICVSVQKIKSQGIISVTDNGIGIPEDNLSRVFDTFFTTKEVGRGTGMGLGIAARLVKELDGQILVESKEGVGSVFRVILPLATKSKVTSVQPEAEEATKPLSPLESSGSVVKRRVLVVDDEPDIREILINELEEIGDYEGVEAKDGQEALELVRSEDFDIIFTDLKMPVMSGTQLLLKIWELRLNPRPILIAVTGGFGLDNQKVGQHNLIDLVDGFILKPFDSGQISKAILDAEKNRETSLQKAMVG